MGIQSRINTRLKSREGKYSESLNPEEYDSQMEEVLKYKERKAGMEREFYSTLDSALLKYTQKLSSLKTDCLGHCLVQTGFPVLPSSVAIKHFEVDKLRAIGVKAIRAADFTILEDQILLGINIKNLVKADNVIDSYSRKCKQFLDEIAVINNKLGTYNTTNKHLDDVSAEIEYLANPATKESNFSDDVRKERKEFLEKQQTKIIAELNALEKAHKSDLESLANVRAAYSMYKQLNNPGVKKDSKDLTENIYNLLLTCVAEINKGLPQNDHLVFPESCNILPTSTGGKSTVPKKFPTPLLHGSMNYYWVMRVGTLHRWLKLVSGNLNITGWDLPQHRWSKIKQKVETEVKSSNIFVDEILRLRRLGSNKDNAYTKMRVFLIKQGKEMDDYFKSVFEKVWADADEVLNSRKGVKTPAITKQPKAASQLLKMGKKR